MKAYFTKLLIYLCISYTSISLTAAVYNLVNGNEPGSANTLVMFAFCLISSIVLSFYELLPDVSPLAMIIIQYLVACALCAVLLLILSLIEPISPKGWFEYYRSFTIPYIIWAGIYYFSVYLDTRKKNDLLKEIQKKEKE
ncbi:MAG: hypothetical protein J5825_00470 [Lachnospiraceae bacterium]|nr:hypothetical protein [Lachnospiraceae bacterium]